MHLMSKQNRKEERKETKSEAHGEGGKGNLRVSRGS